MNLDKKIEAIQKCLTEQQVDGWLLYDNHGSNKFIRSLLAIAPNQVLTRRFFYWIPQSGEPQKILHKIEAEGLDLMPGKKNLYLSWIELEHTIKTILKESKRILMEYSPRGVNPNISVVDAGTIEIIQSFGVEVISSADILQRFTSVLDESQITSHLEAAEILQITVKRVWDLISDSIRNEKRITEYDVQKFILSEFAAQNCITEEGPICAVNEHSALPHYIPTKQSAKEIGRGDFILIDLWCKKDKEEAVYADITRVAVVSAAPTPKQQQVFEIVKAAQKKAIDFLFKRLASHQELMGCEVDDICRGYIKSLGLGEFFTHRTGHNIDTSVHGAGANLDNLETSDYRQLLPGMCFSIEPGIYLIGDFGIRLESNVLIKNDGSVQITGGIEESIVCLL